MLIAWSEEYSSPKRANPSRERLFGKLQDAISPEPKPIEACLEDAFSAQAFLRKRSDRKPRESQKDKRRKRVAASSPSEKASSVLTMNVGRLHRLPWHNAGQLLPANQSIIWSDCPVSAVGPAAETTPRAIVEAGTDTIPHAYTGRWPDASR